MGGRPRCLWHSSSACTGTLRPHPTPFALFQVAESMSFSIDTEDRESMLRVVGSCIGTKYTSRFGSLMAVRVLWCCGAVESVARGGLAWNRIL